MALGPTDIALTPEEVVLISEWEKLIDEQLQKEGGQREVVLLIRNISLNLNMTTRIEKELARRYIKAGWSTVYFSGQIVSFNW